MARVTVEDCVDKVPNRFELVLLAAHRARAIAAGAPMTVDQDRDKNPVVALREIAEQTISPQDLQEEFIHVMQRHVEVDEPEASTVPLIGASPSQLVFGRDDQSTDTQVDRSMSEEELLRNLERSLPIDAGSKGR